MKRRLVDTMSSEPGQVFQLLKDVSCALLRREPAQMRSQTRSAFIDDFVQRILFSPVEGLNPVVQDVTLRLVVLRRRVDEVAWGNG